MSKCDKIKNLTSNEFRRLTGVSKSVFLKMLAVIKSAEYQIRGRELLISIVSMLIKMVRR